jgi:hypothetical protein
MPRVLLLIPILLMIAAAVRSLLNALADAPFAGLERALRDEDPEIPDALLGDDSHAWVHQRLLDAYACEREGWALEQVRRIDARLQADVPPDQRLETVILWINEANAFVIPGRHVYVSRRLVERVRGDEQLAMIIAHEMAHHRLRHVGGIEETLERVPEVARGIAANLIVAHALVLHGADREADADAHGFNLCLDAGYDARRCLEGFDLLEEISLDWGDTEGVFGPDAVIEAELDGEPEWMISLRTWLWERRRGYPSVRERKARLLEAYEQAVAEAATS